MPRAKYYLTETATAQYRKIILDTAQKFGVVQSKKYRAQLRDGFQKIARYTDLARTPLREEISRDTDFSIHLVGHHYIAFQLQTDKHVIIVGIFHERMDLPTRLMELKEKSKKEIMAIKKQII